MTPKQIEIQNEIQELELRLEKAKLQLQLIRLEEHIEMRPFIKTFLSGFKLK